MRLSKNIEMFLNELRTAGAFSSVSEQQAYLVISDERINHGEESQCVKILVQFASLHGGARHSFLIRHSADAVLVRPVTVNRFESSLIVSDDLEKEITIRLEKDVELSRLLAS